MYHTDFTYAVHAGGFVLFVQLPRVADPKLFEQPQRRQWWKHGAWVLPLLLASFEDQVHQPKIVVVLFNKVVVVLVPLCCQGCVILAHHRRRRRATTTTATTALTALAPAPVDRHGGWFHRNRSPQCDAVDLGPRGLNVNHPLPFHLIVGGPRRGRRRLDGPAGVADVVDPHVLHRAADGAHRVQRDEFGGYPAEKHVRHSFSGEDGAQVHFGPPRHPTDLQPSLARRGAGGGGGGGAATGLRRVGVGAGFDDDVARVHHQRWAQAAPDRASNAMVGQHFLCPVPSKVFHFVRFGAGVVGTKRGVVGTAHLFGKNHKVKLPGAQMGIDVFYHTFRVRDGGGTAFEKIVLAIDNDQGSDGGVATASLGGVVVGVGRPQWWSVHGVARGVLWGCVLWVGCLEWWNLKKFEVVEQARCEGRCGCGEFRGAWEWDRNERVEI